MPDREKVIKALEICEKKDCVLCPYTDWCGEYDDCYYDCTKLLARDALELLKEQEVKTGHWIDTTNTIGFPRCECSECNSEAGAIWMKYCPNCGAKMEGR